MNFSLSIYLAHVMQVNVDGAVVSADWWRCRDGGGLGAETYDSSGPERTPIYRTFGGS